MDVQATLPLERPDPLAPPPDYDRLRADAPIARVRTAHGTTAWLVSSHALAVAALTDPRLLMTPPGMPVDERASLFQDGPPHARLRRLVARAFTPRHVARLTPRLVELAERRVAAMADAGPPADLVDALAAPLAIDGIATLLGIEISAHGRFRVLVDAALAADPMLAGQDPERLAAAERAWGDLAAYGAELVAAARDRPGQDLLGDLVAVRDAEDGRLGDGELVALVTSLVAAGALTVRHGLAASVIRLLDRGALALVTGEQRDAVVDELVRQAGAEPFPRWAADDLVLGGASIAAGDMVLVRLEAANHDPAHLADPATFRPGRPESHLGFGRGPHHCLGAALARAEIGAALEVLARRLPTLRLAVPLADVPWTDGEVDRGPLSVLLSW